VPAADRFRRRRGAAGLADQHRAKARRTRAHVIDGAVHIRYRELLDFRSDARTRRELEHARDVRGASSRAAAHRALEEQRHDRKPDIRFRNADDDEPALRLECCEVVTPGDIRRHC